SSHLVDAYLDGQTKFSSIGNQSGAGSEIELIDSQSSQAKGLGLTLSSSYAVNDWFSLLLAYKYQDYQASNSAGSAFPDFSANGLQAGFRIGW
ncbi:MAG: hypothetical protein KDC71_24395, partial [Acidobacteria bacterium]|nr:hypothetical protein [Acidobacteriota bacterium]